MQTIDRTKFIGGSDAAAVLGLSRWKTPLAIWAEKTGNIVPEDISGKLAVKLGQELEDFVAREFTEQTGKKVRRVNEEQIHPDYPFIRAQVDRRIVGENEILECKTASAYKEKEWLGEEIPREYIIQVYHQLAVTGAKRGYIAVLIGNHNFKWQVIERDEKVIKDIISREVQFWTDFIEPKIMPHIITANDSDTLYSLYPEEEPGSEIKLGDEADRIIESINSLYADYKNIESQMDKQKNELKALLKDNQIGETARYIITWKSQQISRIDTQRLKDEQPDIYKGYLKESASRVLRYREKKEKTNG